MRTCGRSSRSPPAGPSAPRTSRRCASSRRCSSPSTTRRGASGSSTGSGGTADGLTAFFQDVTEREQTQRELELRELRYRTLAHAFASVVWASDAEGNALPSDSWTSLTGRGDAKDAKGDVDWREAVHEDDLDRVNAAWATAFADRTEYDETYRLRVPSGAWRHVRARGVPVLVDDAVVQWIGVIDDVTERLAAEEALRRAALEDPLTGLPNRAVLLDRLEALLRRREHRHAAVLYLDVDRFKAINDAHGHAAGDTLLQAVAERLVAGVRPADVVSRLSGDEFVVLCDELTSDDEAVTVAERLAAAASAPVDGLGADVTVAVGVAAIMPGDTDAEAVLKAADAAMYDVKARGGDGVEVYGAELRDRLRRRAWVADQLRGGLEHDGLDLHFQPVIHVSSPGVTPTVEALLRWRACDGTILPAGEAIEVAEKTGLIVPIGKGVVWSACRAAAAWNARRDEPLAAVAINVSPREFARPDELVAEVAAALEATGLPGDLLRLEITESVVIDDVARAEDVLGRLRALGCMIAIDDFGVGYSSLSYLHQLPVDAVKIDRAFISRLPGDAGSAQIIAAVVGIARAFDMKVVAEGIETAEQLEAVRAMGCDSVQGYLLARPAPADDVPAAVTAAGERAHAG